MSSQDNIWFDNNAEWLNIPSAISEKSEKVSFHIYQILHNIFFYFCSCIYFQTHSCQAVKLILFEIQEYLPLDLYQMQNTILEYLKRVENKSCEAVCLRPWTL